MTKGNGLSNTGCIKNIKLWGFRRNLNLEGSNKSRTSDFYQATRTNIILPIRTATLSRVSNNSRYILAPAVNVISISCYSNYL